jgi:hypothetical protein
VIASTKLTQENHDEERELNWIDARETVGICCSVFVVQI